MTNWGKIIRDLRIEQGIAQRGLARSAGVNRSVLRRIEEGKSTGESPTIGDILKALGYELRMIKVADPMSDEALALLEKRYPQPEPEPDLKPQPQRKRGPKPQPEPKPEPESWGPIDPVEAGRRERLASHRTRYGG